MMLNGLVFLLTERTRLGDGEVLPKNILKYRHKKSTFSLANKSTFSLANKSTFSLAKKQGLNTGYSSRIFNFTLLTLFSKINKK